MTYKILGNLVARLLLAFAAVGSGPAAADVPKAAGQETFLYAWTLGIEGLGREPIKRNSSSRSVGCEKIHELPRRQIIALSQTVYHINFSS